MALRLAMLLVRLDRRPMQLLLARWLAPRLERLDLWLARLDRWRQLMLARLASCGLPRLPMLDFFLLRLARLASYYFDRQRQQLARLSLRRLARLARLGW